ncbi:MAG: hypothetical protein ABI241_00490 [Bacteroidia bacterium]
MSSDIKELLRNITKTNEEIYSIICKVKIVNKTDKTCDCSPIDGTADIFDVKLIADKTTGMLLIPKIDSIVIVSMTSVSSGYIGMFSTVDEIQLNGDNYEGLPKIKELVKKYNQLEKSVNDLKKLLINWIVVPNDGGAALKTITTAWASAAIIETQQNELENKTVTHGG